MSRHFGTKKKTKKKRRKYIEKETIAVLLTVLE